MTNDNNTPIDTTNATQTPLNIAATDATVTTAGTNTALTAAETTTTTLPMGNAADETTRRSLFGAGLYQTAFDQIEERSIKTGFGTVFAICFLAFPRNVCNLSRKRKKKMTNDNNTPIDTTYVIQTPLNVAATDATVTNIGNITASTAAATTSTILPAGNAADETTRRSLFGAGLYQTAFDRIEERSIKTGFGTVFAICFQALPRNKKKMTNDNNTPIDTTDVIQTPVNVAATDATVTYVGNITASTAAATISTILPAGNATDETTRRSLFGAGLYQTAFDRIEERSIKMGFGTVFAICFLALPRKKKKMTNDNNTPIDTTDVIQTPLNIAATDATVASVGNITASTAAATTSTILPAGNAADETTRRSLFGAGLYQTGSVSATASQSGLPAFTILTQNRFMFKALIGLKND
ncbi:hypothetical protein F2Q70_00025507 [Brassica cretica]|uniref:Uncharacterized protein n=1 Tax=Brassica cretica TaxID=69181 RepID=A0A8S9LDV8_BRACR|nr:hypothetical protein F2Q70_00025507 [Brassica cretica]